MHLRFYVTRVPEQPLVLPLSSNSVSQATEVPMVLRWIIGAAVAVAATPSALAQIGADRPAASPDQEYFRHSLAASSLMLALCLQPAAWRR
jgi:hypothetical protein